MGFNVPQCPQFLEKQVCKIFIIRNYQIPSTFRHISLSVELIAPIKPGFNRIDLLCHFFPPQKLFPGNTQSRIADPFKTGTFFQSIVWKKYQLTSWKKIASNIKSVLRKKYWIVVETKFLLPNWNNPLHRVTVYIIYI